MNDLAVLACLQRLTAGTSLPLSKKIVSFINLDLLVVALVAYDQL
jgi:hypothetical protein